VVCVHCTLRTQISRPICNLTHTTVAVAEGCIVIAGGDGADGSTLASADLFNPVTDTWTSVAPLTHVRYGAAAYASGGRVHVSGGVG
jgi:hypothetical protein